MIRHWWQSTFLFFALFALVACSSAAPDAESTSVEVLSMTPILLTPSPQPSATPFPTETASLTPTPQPSLTATSESTLTPQPTEVPATPTPAPEFGMRRQNPETNQQEYWDGESWITPTPIQLDAESLAYLYPTQIEATPLLSEKDVPDALNNATPWSTEEFLASASEQSSYIIIDNGDGDLGLGFPNTFLPIAYQESRALIEYADGTREVPVMSVYVAYKNSSGDILKGTLIFTDIVQIRAGSTVSVDTIPSRLEPKPTHFGGLLYDEADPVQSKRARPDYAQHLPPYQKTTLEDIAREIQEGNFVFGLLDGEATFFPSELGQ